MGSDAGALGCQAGDGRQPGRAVDRRAGRQAVACAPQAGGGQESGARPTHGEEEHEAALTAAAWTLLAVAAALAVGDWVAVARGNKALEYVCKPAVMVALIGVALTLHPTISGRRDWFVLALVLSMLGDVFLMLPRDLFVAGLSSFLLGHIAYVVGFRVHGGSGAAWALAAAGVIVVDLVLARPILSAVRARHRDLLVPVVAYMLVISAMVSAALATGVALAVVGAALFFASDTLIAWSRFVKARPWMPLAIIVTYHAGQTGLVLSLAR
jgi:uncharacterized membrane protein YhhN